MYTPTRRTTATRHRERVRYDAATAHAILDEALECRLAFVVDGEPRILPTLHVRLGDTLYLHCSTGSPPARAAATGDGLPLCVEVSLIDALVLARSQFHHSVDYRSVVVHGRAVPVADPGRKRAVLAALVDKVGGVAERALAAAGDPFPHAHPGTTVGPRSTHTRAPHDRELAQTAVLAVPLREVSVKVREGGVVDDPADLALPYWAGILPLRVTAGVPAADAGVTAPLPAYLRAGGPRADRLGSYQIM